VASSEVAAVAPTVTLLSAFGVLIALAAGFSAGTFLVRRRADEAHALYARGEGPLPFAGRVAVESLLPGVLAFAIGVGAALLALRAIAPGATDSGTVRAAALRAALGAAAALAVVAVGSATAFPRDPGARSFARRVSGVPWELVPLGLAAGVLALLLADRGLISDAGGSSHPRLAVFVLPLIAVPGVAGLATRAVKRLIRGSGRAAPAPVYLAVRRLTAASGVLLTVVAASATALGTFAYTSVLSASLSRATAEKAWVANGSDVQGLVDPHVTVAGRSAFPTALVEVDSANASFSSGERVDLIAGDPRALARTLRWGRGWADDPRPLLPKLDAAGSDRLAAIATPGAPDETVVIDQGARLPIRIVGHAAVPGATADRPALLVSRSELRRFTRRAHILEPAPQAVGLVWAKGPSGPVERALAVSPLAPVFMTTPAHILDDASVRAAARSYRFVRVIGAAAAGLSVLSLLVYLQARRRSQLIATAIVRRMGVGRVADGGAVAVEAGLIVLFAGLIGGAVGVGCARAVAPHVDSLPQYAPGPAFVVPWLILAAGLLGVAIVSAVLAAAATMLTSRAEIAEALRVA
jgi:putative ABC transport system permease protein